MNEESVLETLERKYIGKIIKFYYNTDFERTCANLSLIRQKNCDSIVVHMLVLR